MKKSAIIIYKKRAGKESTQLFVSNYKTVLPTEKELMSFIMQENLRLEDVK